jgi:hypothetical protein
LVILLPLGLNGLEVPGEVSTLQEAPDPEPKDYPYHAWAAQAASLEHEFPPLPKDPESSNPKMAMEIWAAKTGLRKKYLLARGEYAAHRQKLDQEKAESDKKKMSKQIQSAALIKAQQDELLRASEANKDDNPKEEGVSQDDLEAAQVAMQAKQVEEAQIERQAEDTQATKKTEQSLEMAEAIRTQSMELDGPEVLLQEQSEPTVHVKHGSSLHKAATKQEPDADAGVTRYYGKKDEVLHRNDPAYDPHRVPEALQKEAKEAITAVATAAANSHTGNAAFEQYKQSVIATAVSTAAPKLAELKHKANIKAGLQVREAKAQARATVEIAKKAEEKQESATPSAE